jgi:hypothetical protein
MPYIWVASTNLKAHVFTLVALPPTVQALATLIGHNLTCLLALLPCQCHFCQCHASTKRSKQLALPLRSIAAAYTSVESHVGSA